MIKEVRASGLMIGIELGAPSSGARAAELALDPHGERGAVPAADRDPAASRPRRDHDGGRQERRDQAAAAADALRERGAQLPGRARRRARRVPRPRQQEPGRSCATSPPRRSVAGHARSSRERAQAGARGARRAVAEEAPPSRDELCLVTGASGFIGGRLSRAPRAGRPHGALPRAREQRHLGARRARQSSSSSATSPMLDSLVRAARRLRTTCCTAARSSPTGPPSRRSPASTSTARATCSRPARGVRAALRPLQHHRRLRPSRRRADRRVLHAHAISQLVRADQAGKPRPRSAAPRRPDALDAVILRPATVYGPGSKDVVGEIARAIRDATCC